MSRKTPDAAPGADDFAALDLSGAEPASGEHSGDPAPEPEPAAAADPDPAAADPAAERNAAGRTADEQLTYEANLRAAEQGEQPEPEPEPAPEPA
jgi:hypothetical protein